VSSVWVRTNKSKGSTECYAGLGWLYKNNKSTDDEKDGIRQI
jgi:hypothetical protein